MYTSFSIQVLPQIAPFDFGDESINEGDSTSASCSIHKGDLPINISWLHNNISIGYIDGIMITKAGKKVSTITIDSVQDKHSGWYTCVAENKAGRVSFSTRLDVNVDPQISPFTFGEDPINAGDSTYLTCSVHKGDLPVDISWLHNNKSIDDIDGVLVSRNGKKASTVTIDSIQEKHAGVYTCLAENKVGVAKYSATLKVNVPPHIVPFDFGEEPVNSGDVTSIQCTVVKGDFPVNITWFHNNETIHQDSGVNIFTNGKKISSLSIDNVEERNRGLYTCLVQNRAGSASYTAELQVIVPPDILPFDFGKDQINSGDFASLTCSVHKGDLPINISWLHNNISIGYIDGIMTTKAGKKASTITIDAAQEVHAGEYTCVGENKAGATRYSSLLHVHVAPDILPFDFGKEQINSGDFASLQCSVHKGDLPINISWLHNNISIGYIDGIMVTKAGKKVSTLTIDSAQETHTGEYTCVAENKAGVTRYSTQLHVNVSPDIVPFDFGKEQINSGDFATLQCSVHKGDLPINISWLHNNISIGYVKGVMVSKVGKKVSTVTIDSAEEVHSGEYTCVAENKAGAARYSTRLHVHVPPQILPFDFGEESVNSGDVASLQCTVFKGDFPLNITWLQNNRSINYNSGILITQTGKKVSSLTIESVGADHTGRYSCLVQNGAGSIQYSTILNVNVLPIITPFDFGDEPINSGDYASIQCSVHKGDLPLEISWLHNNKSLGYTDGVLVTKVGKKASSLTIDSVEDKHSGVYTCSATNQAGVAHYSSELSVNVIPQILPFNFGEDSVNSGDVASLQCTVHKGDLPINITWFHNAERIGYTEDIIISQPSKKVSILTIDDVKGSHLGNYTCLAQNTVGSSSESTILHVNVAPQILHFDFGEDSVNSGDLASLQCTVHKGDLPMNITWSHNNKSISYDGGVMISSVGKKISTLSIDSVQAKHCGIYTCTAQNAAGKSSYSAVLNVNGDD
ncbi:hypothetical protein JTB14_005122 [Gonioctena quinquepunctata]|nr:hypothetical protein JTB14_005122 [Gonioctena quinquepunctata]